MKKGEVTILAIETSCDETAAAVLRGNVGSKKPEFKILSSVLRSQIKLHAAWGGVVPEIAARAHVSAIKPVVEKALSNYGLKLEARSSKLEPVVDFIAVTSGPGLIASLLVGVEFAKTLASVWDVPMLPTNHMLGHLYSPFGQSTKNDRVPSILFPMLSVIVSGGHTMLVLQKDESHYKVIGSTVDDAAGEAFDKVARMLELPYPGGPEISKLALKGKPNIRFPRPMLDKKNYDFSFSGLKTSVLYYLQKLEARSSQLKADVARSFEQAVVDVLVGKATRAAKEYNCKTISLSGGVAANTRLRKTLAQECKKLKIDCIVPPFALCTDNAGMIAIAAYFSLRANKKPRKPEEVHADAGWEI